MTQSQKLTVLLLCQSLNISAAAFTARLRHVRAQLAAQQAVA